MQKHYDAILLWETPVPFLEHLFPEALIVHQMPGAFSRPPYPHTVTFDAGGLFKDSTLFRESETILSGGISSGLATLADAFADEMRRVVDEVQPFDLATLDPGKCYDRLALLPLQVSSHYSFQADTGFESQSGFLSAVMERVPQTTGVVVTQYRSRLIADTLLDEDRAGILRQQWPNIIFHNAFDRIPSSSQYLLPFVDEVFSCSSSLAIQAQIWNRPVHILGNTNYAPFDRKKIADSGRQTADVYRNSLGFILGQQQPLAQAVVSDGQFLTSLLEEMVARKRSGKTGVNLHPEYTSIDPDYATRLVGGARIDTARKSLPLLEVPTNIDREIGKFAKSARDPEIKAVSFDVFDTLITRPTEVPADVYTFLERIALEVTDGAAEDFARIRLNSEVSTRAVSTAGEITLAEIYASVQAFYGFSDETIEKLMRREIELEISLVEPRGVGIAMWQYAQKLGKPLYIISDMYLPEETIRAMLDKCGVTGFAEIFVSSAHGVRKKEGPLFDIVLSTIGLTGAQVLHIGDNKEADGRQAVARGMQSFVVPRAIDHMRANPYFKKIYDPRTGGRERARSVVAGLTARRLFDLPKGEEFPDSHFFGKPFNLGFAGLGPLVTGYVLWLERAARRDGVTRLYFLSREGKVLRDVYETLFSDVEDRIPSTYLYASRRATRVASLRSRSDVLATAAQPYRAGVEVGKLLRDRFGIDFAAVPEGEREVYGFRDPEFRLTAEQTEKVAFISLCGDLSDRILGRAEIERTDYLEYLASVGLETEARPAVVDIGWKANMQGALGNLIGKPISGYYLATLEGADVWLRKGHRISAYIGDFVSQIHPSVCIRNRHVLEYLVCHRDPSLLYFNRGKNGVGPVFRAEDNQGVRSTFIDGVHSGIRQFAADFQQSFAFARSDIWIDPHLAEQAIASFLLEPAEADAKLLVGLHFEDSVGGVSRQYLVAPNPEAHEGDSVWKIGAATLYRQKRAPRPGKPAPAWPAKPEVNDRVPRRLRGRLGRGLRRIEGVVVNRIAKGKKLAKYERDRDSFFRDSKNRFLQTWWHITGLED